MSVDLGAHSRRSALPEEPFELFESWLRQAEEAPEIQYPQAMCLSTVSSDGMPQGRFVIAHPVAAGLVFLTDARSPKAKALESRPAAALTAYWGRPLELQVRIEGEVGPAATEVADAIFSRRPARSQTTPWVSRQSEPTTLDHLATELERVESEWAGHDSLPRPEHWRGYRLEPRLFEFWEARSRRLHDRFLYTRSSGAWSRQRLSP